MALTTWAAFYAAHPNKTDQLPHAAWWAKGIGTNDFYAVEVDPTTGALPVSASISFSNDTNYGTVGASTLRTAAQIGNATGAADFNAGAAGAQTLRVVLATGGATPLPTGAATAAKQPALGTAGTASADVITVQGIASMTPILTSPSTSPAGSTFANAFVRNDYTSTAVTTAAYVQLVASTTNATNRLIIFDSSGQTMKIAIGAAASEIDQFVIFPGGIDIPYAIPAGSRVSIRAITATANVGEIDINFLK